MIEVAQNESHANRGRERGQKVDETKDRLETPSDRLNGHRQGNGDSQIQR
jgi:hypothetical protein